MAEDAYWYGWLIDDMGMQKDFVLSKIEEVINAKKIPMYGNRDKDEGIEVKKGTVDMWWRRDTPELSIKSEMDGTVKASVATQDYGSSLWVHLIVEREHTVLEEMTKGNWEANWAKMMAWTAFQVSLQRTVEEAVHLVADKNIVTGISDPRKRG